MYDTTIQLEFNFKLIDWNRQTKIGSMKSIVFYSIMALRLSVTISRYEKCDLNKRGKQHTQKLDVHLNSCEDIHKKKIKKTKQNKISYSKCHRIPFVHVLFAIARRSDVSKLSFIFSRFFLFVLLFLLTLHNICFSLFFFSFVFYFYFTSYNGQCLCPPNDIN